MDFDRVTGKQSFMTLGGVDIPFTKVTPRFHRAFINTTDSTYYDPESGLVFPTQTATSLGVQLDVEGRFRYSVVPGNILAYLFDGSISVAGQFFLEESYQFLDGYFDIEDFEMEIPYDDVVNFTATMKSHGVFSRT